MRIFHAFLIIFAAAFLFMLPLTTLIYDFRTDVRTDSFSTTTGVGVNSANETLLAALYNDDLGSVAIFSNEATDNALPNSYNTTTRALLVTQLAGNTTRTLDITYDIDALQGSPTINTIADRFPWIWLLMIIAFAPAALLALFIGKT